MEIVTSNFIEDLDKDKFSHPCEYVKENAKQKAVEVWKRLSSRDVDARPDLVIGADTVVTLDEMIYEKPRDSDDAFRMLSKLSGQKHTVFTGVALVTPAPPDQTSGDSRDDFVVTTFHEGTDVVMTELSENLIRKYIETGEPYDKAGGYAIQGIGGSLIEGIRGDYFNVMGLPLHRLCKELYHMFSD